VSKREGSIDAVPSEKLQIAEQQKQQQQQQQCQNTFLQQRATKYSGKSYNCTQVACGKAWRSTATLETI
jgi:hypothetical protein